MFSHVFIDIFLPDMRFSHGFLNIWPLEFLGFPLGSLWDPGLMFSQVFIDIFLPDMRFSPVFINILNNWTGFVCLGFGSLWVPFGPWIDVFSRAYWHFPSWHEVFSWVYQHFTLRIPWLRIPLVAQWLSDGLWRVNLSSSGLRWPNGSQMASGG